MLKFKRGENQMMTAGMRIKIKKAEDVFDQPVS